MSHSESKMKKKKKDRRKFNKGGNGKKRLRPNYFVALQITNPEVCKS